MISHFTSVFCRVVHYWSYPNTIETAVLVVILYDVIWHRWNAIRDIERDKEAEFREVQREEAAEKRQIRREQQEFVRKHWQELQANLILLCRVIKDLTQQRRFVNTNNDSRDPTTRHLLLTMTSRLPELLAEFDDRWACVVAQLNVFPEPRDLLALDILEVIQEVGKTINDKHIEVTDETLGTLASLTRKVAGAAKLQNPDE